MESYQSHYRLDLYQKTDYVFHLEIVLYVVHTLSYFFFPQTTFDQNWVYIYLDSALVSYKEW